MLGTVFLQITTKTVTTTVDIPWTVYATLGAAFLAALASLNATRISSKTARDLGVLSAQTSRESAHIAAETAKRIKESDYKNDYYKRVIEKRIRAIELLEELLSLFLVSGFIQGTEKRYHLFFTDKENSKRLGVLIDKVSAAGIWYGTTTAIKIREFTRQFLTIESEANELDKAKRQEFIMDKFHEINDMVIGLQKGIAHDIYTMHDVEGFFAARLELNSKK